LPFFSSSSVFQDKKLMIFIMIIFLEINTTSINSEAYSPEIKIYKNLKEDCKVTINYKLHQAS